MSAIRRVFQVNGKPFFPLGAQSRNSSGYNAAEAETAFEAVKLIHGNTLEIPVYWEQIEPVEGQFDFASVDALLASARRHDLKLVLLWFGTWKNGTASYVPAWVKADPARFHRVATPLGRRIRNLSSHCRANLEADKRAFRALCEHLKAADAEHQTVIALQVENEPGILGADRDYGPDGQQVFEGPVPAELLARLAEAPSSPVHALWQQAGGAKAGSWSEVFGWAAGEIMTAWSIARYIDEVAAAGKEVYDLPMYVNVWLDSGPVPGGDYPSGGGTSRVLDVHRWAAPHIDLVAPDIYIASAKGYEAACATYAREDNPLFVPESAPGGSNSWLMFRALADYNAIGYAFFAVEHLVDEAGGLRPGLQQIADSFRAAAAAIPLLLEHQGTGRVHAIVQEEGMGGQLLDLDGYHGRVDFGDGPPRFVGKDWRHPSKRAPWAEPTGERGRGLVFQTGPREFYLVGANFRLYLRPKLSPEQSLDYSVQSDFLGSRLADYICVDEGHFDAAGRFVVDRRRNGDETDHGVWVEADTGVVHVVLAE